MKSLLFSLFCLGFFFSCTNANTLTFEAIKITHTTCETCPRVVITVPKATKKSKLSESIQTTVSEEVISLLLFNEEKDVNSISEAIKTFEQGFHELQKQNTPENTVWEAKIDAHIIYENTSILTIAINTYLFTGGAHSYNSVRLLNFDKQKGIVLENLELFKDMIAFQNYAEIQFRSQEKIPESQAINATGFMFDNNTFYLPENIGYTKDGIQLIYNQYEITSYAEKPISLILAYDKINAFLAETNTSASLAN